jgi:hypothetical protein
MGAGLGSSRVNMAKAPPPRMLRKQSARRRRLRNGAWAPAPAPTPTPLPARAAPVVCRSLPSLLNRGLGTSSTTNWRSAGGRPGFSSPLPAKVILVPWRGDGVGLGAGWGVSRAGSDSGMRVAGWAGGEGGERNLHHGPRPAAVWQPNKWPGGGRPRAAVFDSCASAPRGGARAPSSTPA